MARDSWLKRLIWLRGSPAGGSGSSYEKTVGPAPIISISDAKPKPAKSLIVGMEPIQAGSGDPSPDNIRPISGRTGVTVERTGVNMFNSSISLGGRGAVEQADGSWYLSDVSSIPARTIMWSNPSGYTGQITISYTYKNINSTGSQGGRFVWEYSDGTTTTIYANNSTTYTALTNTSTSGKTVVSLQWDYGSSVNSTWFKDVQIELGSTASDYSEYSGATYPVTWQDEAGTVYGGTVDVVSGVLTVTMAMVDLGTLTWTMSTIGTYKRFYSNTIGSQIKPPATPTIIPDIISSQYVAVDFTTAYRGVVNGSASITDATSGSRGNINVVDDRYADAKEFKAAMSGVQLCYYLATPQTYQLTPTQIQMLKGANVLWSDADDLTLTYIGTTPPNLLGGMLGGGFGGGYNPPAEQDPEELTEPEATETDEPADETPAEEGENNGE